MDVSKLNIIQLDDTRYLIYHSIVGNLRIIDKKLLYLLLNSEKINGTENMDMMRYLDLFQADGYIKSNLSLKDNIKETVMKEDINDVINIDLEQYPRMYSQEEIVFDIHTNLLRVAPDTKCFITINIGEYANNLLVAKKIIKHLEKDSIYYHFCIRTPIQYLMKYNHMELDLPTHTLLEITMDNSCESSLAILENITKKYSKERMIIKYSSKDITLDSIEDTFKVIAGNQVMFHLDYEIKREDSLNMLQEKIITLYQLAIQYKVTLHSWLLSPFESLLDSNRVNNRKNIIMDLPLKQIVIRNKGFEVENSKQNIDSLMNELYENRETIDSSYSKGYSCSIEGFCKFSCKEMHKSEKNINICDLLNQLTKKMLYTRFL